ncbi:MAG: presenilin family intramembrane aspartyl protease PSH [Haloarculaceae archaeon]
MNGRARVLAACGGIAAIFLCVQLGALALVDPLKAGGNQFVEDTGDPTNSVVYIALILVATAAMLAVIRLDLEWVLRGFVIFSGGYIAWYVFRVVAPGVYVSVGGVPVNVLAVALAVGLAGALYVYPEWYVVDAAGIVMGVGAAGLFGINFGILPALVLLTVLAVYDAISVYGTEHMLTLASGVMDLRVPVVLVVPLTLSYSFLDADLPDPEAEEAEEAEEAGEQPDAAAADGGHGNAVESERAGAAEGGHAEDDEGDVEANEAEPDTADGSDEDDYGRDALFIGLGDAVIPAVLVASAGFFLSGVPTLPVPGLALTLPAATAMVGTFLGLVVLLRMVLAGRAHAGLPLLNGGAIGGYLVGALASGLSLTQALGLGGVL